MPERVERKFFAVFSSGENRLWQNGKAATNDSEATSLGEAAKLNRAFARTINFENRMENLGKLTEVVFRAIQQANFVIRGFDPAIAILKLCDFAAEEFVTLFRPVPTKAFTVSELFGRSFHCLDRSPWQRLGHVPDAATN